MVHIDQANHYALYERRSSILYRPSTYFCDDLAAAFKVREGTGITTSLGSPSICLIQEAT